MLVLEDLDATLLARIWPACAVVRGLKVSRRVRSSLKANAEKVVFVRSSSPRTTRMAAVDFCSDLMLFEHKSLEVEIHMVDAYPISAAVLHGATLALRKGFSGRAMSKTRTTHRQETPLHQHRSG